MIAAAGAFVLSWGTATATELSSTPLFTSTAIKPNIMFLMDDSGSMARNFLPDRAVAWGKETQYGLWSTHCNYMAYNPAYVYSPPVDAKGVPLPNADVASAFSVPRFYYVYGGKEPDMNFDYQPNGTVNWNVFYGECVSALDAQPGASVFTRKDLTASSPDAQNYANWLAYYGNRREMVKTAIKQVFARLDTNYRVGFSVTSSASAKDNSQDPYWKRYSFIDVRDFSAAQKDLFFTALDKSDNGADTPLRGALSKAGQYFANKAYQQGYDPVQRSCQRNFAVLATDGGWTRAGENPGGATYGPLGLDNATSVGQQDSGTSVLRPFRDAGGDQLPALADVAAYYYKTDLRTPELKNCGPASGPDLCKNNVPGTVGDAYQSYGDSANWQHLTLFTVGLGLSGNIKYRPDYTTARSGDFHDIVTGAKDWPALADPGSKNDYMPLSHTDDMWHAAVNARGRHFAANDPAGVVSSLATALDLIRASTGAGASASTSSLQPVEGDNDVFLAQFTSQKWTGDLLAFKINPDTGEISTTKTWSAKEQLDKPSVSADTRRIFYAQPGAAPGAALRDFTAANLGADGLADQFADFCTRPGAAPGSTAPAQCSSLKLPVQALANDPANMVAFLRGDLSLTALYRARESRLGDIINASPVFVGKPGFAYSDPSYQSFKSSKANRTAVVLAAANDGMLHAFDRATGAELWAFVPSFVMPNMYKLADASYANNHIYLVDGSPQVADIKVGGAWKTIVVGGLNAGGRGYYALDITDPGSPRFLWEFSEPDLGLTFGNPLVVSRNNPARDWVVVFGSGYNNTSPGDGKGHLFVIDAATGALQMKLGTGGVASDGIAKINAWVESESENVAQRFYGGDLLGNVWRFDIDDHVAPPGNEAFPLALLKDAAGKAQPVTTMPILAELKSAGAKFPVVFVGTGRYLGLSDVSDAQVQSIYAIKDPLTASSWGSFRDRADAVAQKINVTTDTTGRTARSITAQPVDWAGKAGWYADFPVPGERVTVDLGIALDRLLIASNLPSPDTCAVGGSSFMYSVDLQTGGGFSTPESYVLTLGFTAVQRKNGAVDRYVTGADGTLTNLPGAPGASASALKRISWREIVD